VSTRLPAGSVVNSAPSRGSGDSAFNYPGEEREDRVKRLRKAERIGRPVGDAAFLD